MESTVSAEVRTLRQVVQDLQTLVYQQKEEIRELKSRIQEKPCEPQKDNDEGWKVARGKSGRRIKSSTPLIPITRNSFSVLRDQCLDDKKMDETTQSKGKQDSKVACMIVSLSVPILQLLHVTKENLD